MKIKYKISQEEPIYIDYNESETLELGDELEAYHDEDKLSFYVFDGKYYNVFKAVAKKVARIQFRMLFV